MKTAASSRRLVNGASKYPPHLWTMAREIERDGRAQRMPHRVQPRLQGYRLHPELGSQSNQCPIGCGPRIRDIGPAFALSVARIIDEQEGVSGALISRRQWQPIQRERAVAAEDDPNSIRQTGSMLSWNVERRLAAGTRLERQLDHTRRK